METGKNHGVYLNGENGNVKCCLQKKSVEVLRKVGAVNESDCVDDFGDDWMFTITVSKISEVQEDFEPRVIKSKGTIQQYPDWDEEDFDEE